LQGIHGKEVCILQDARFESFGLPWDDWLRWGESETVMVKMPRNTHKTSVPYTGTAPLFATMADLFSYPLDEAKKFGRSVEKENRQWRSRWRLVRFDNAIPEYMRDAKFKPCMHCAATWYLAAEGPVAVATPVADAAFPADAMLLAAGVPPAALSRSTAAAAPPVGATPSASSVSAAGAATVGCVRGAKRPGSDSELVAKVAGVMRRRFIEGWSDEQLAVALRTLGD
jgi:hypothetical protein